MLKQFRKIANVERGYNEKIIRKPALNNRGHSRKGLPEKSKNSRAETKV